MAAVVEAGAVQAFLSWSGPSSNAVARSFHRWLPHVVQAIDPFLSSEDIEKGENWLGVISAAIRSAKGVGLFFLTEDALKSGWLHFEAGGIASSDRKRVCTVLCGLAKEKVPSPFSHFQATELVADDVRKLVRTLNSLLERPLDPAVIETSFDRNWPTLDAELQELKKAASSAKPTAAAEPTTRESELTLVLRAIRGLESRMGALEKQRAVPVAQVPFHSVSALSLAEQKALMGSTNKLAELLKQPEREALEQFKADMKAANDLLADRDGYLAAIKSATENTHVEVQALIDAYKKSGRPPPHRDAPESPA